MTDQRLTPSQAKHIRLGLGQNIAACRRRHGWTQQELADRVGIDSVTVSRLETGTSLPSLLRLAAIADVLGVSLSDLVAGISPRVSDQATEIATWLTKVEEEDRYLLLDMVKRLAARFALK